MASISPAANAATSTSKNRRRDPGKGGYLSIRASPGKCILAPLTTIRTGDPHARILKSRLLGCLLLAAGPLLNGVAQDVWDQVEHRFADSNGVKIHYAVLGEGPLVVMIHGFPDFWYTWRHQMRALADHKYRVAAVDMRGYNLSDKPKGVESYAMPLLVGDIAAVVKAEKQTDAIIVGHDWGGAVAWNVAMSGRRSRGC